MELAIIQFFFSSSTRYADLCHGDIFIRCLVTPRHCSKIRLLGQITNICEGFVSFVMVVRFALTRHLASFVSLISSLLQ
jgi:hypothetical protein